MTESAPIEQTEHAPPAELPEHTPIVQTPLARLLAGRLVLVPRGGERGEQTARQLAALEAGAVLVPLIEQVPPLDSAPFAAAVAALNSGAYDWVAVTSAHGAAALIAAGARPGSARVAAVGPATAERLTAAGFAVDLVPPEFTGAELAAHLVEVIRTGGAASDPVGAGSTAPPSTPLSDQPELSDQPAAHPSESHRVLLPLSEIAEPTLEHGLREAGLVPERVTAYRTLPVAPDAAADAELLPLLGAALVFSSSGARALAERFAPLPDGVVVAAIGEPTARELARLGIPAAVVAAEHTAAGTVSALAAYAECAAAATSGPTPNLLTTDSEGTAQ